jgi:hypothetical protein
MECLLGSFLLFEKIHRLFKRRGTHQHIFPGTEGCFECREKSTVGENSARVAPIVQPCYREC